MASIRTGLPLFMADGRDALDAGRRRVRVAATATAASGPARSRDRGCLEEVRWRGVPGSVTRRTAEAVVGHRAPPPFGCGRVGGLAAGGRHSRGIYRTSRPAEIIRPRAHGGASTPS